jgi:hypothetical protein
MSRLRESLRAKDSSSNKKSRLDPVGWGGVGLLSAGVLMIAGGGGAMFAMAAGRADAVSSDSMCNTKVKVGGVPQCPHFGANDDPSLNLALKPASADFERQGKTFDTVGMALTGVGAGLAVAGGAMLVYDVVKRSRAEHPVVKKRKVKKVIEVEEPAASLHLAPVVGPREVGLVSEYRF